MYNEALLEHKEILEMLLEKRISRKEINLNVWAQVTAEKLKLSHTLAYARVKKAARALAAADAGEYKEGRRGRESRFKASMDIKEYVNGMLAEMAAKEALPPQTDVDSFRRMLDQVQKPSLKEILATYTIEEVVEAARDRLNKS